MGRMEKNPENGGRHDFFLLSHFPYEEMRLPQIFLGKKKKRKEQVKT